MPKKPKAQARDPKVDALQRQGCLHPHPKQVTDPLFSAADFFDARDLVQVKYEMLRRVRAQGEPITESAAAFGFSRPSFYQAQSAFELGGLAGLLPKKRGPRGSHKLSTEIMAYLQQLLSDDPSLRASELAERVLARFGCKVHPRSVERALARQKKKQG
jgi:transposase